MALQGLDKLAGAMYSGNFTITFATPNFSVELQQVWNFLKVGQIVTLWPAARVSGTSGDTGFTTAADAIPSFLRPLRSARFVADATDNGLPVGCIVLLNASNGAISLGASLTSSLILNWTGSGTKAFPNSSTLSPYFTYAAVAN